MASLDEDFLTFYGDPGEDTGWALGKGGQLLASGTHRMWNCVDTLDIDLREGTSEFRDKAYSRSGEDLDDAGVIKRIVVENFRLYPWIIYGPGGNPTHALDFEEFRTVRAIGAYQLLARQHQLEFITQPAKIKKEAVSAGAEELYDYPLHENRHQNDAKQHFVYYRAMEMLA